MGCAHLWVRVEIMGPGKYENVEKSQSVLITINPMIFTRTRTCSTANGSAPAPARGPAHATHPRRPFKPPFGCTSFGVNGLAAAVASQSFLTRTDVT
jgi:hypothetical protein